MDHTKDEEDIVLAIKRVTGAETARLTKAPSLFWAKAGHWVGIHTRRLSYEYDTFTGSLRFMGNLCVVCRK